MTDWIKASNPAAPITTEAEAISAARASALAIFLGVAWGIVGIVYLMTAGQALMDAAIAEASAQSPEAAGMAGMMTQGLIGLSVGLIVIQLIIGLVQWFKPNIVIPIIFAILVAFGLITGLMAALGIGQPENAAAFSNPVWLTWGGIVVMVIELILHIAGIRGARMLDKLRMAAAQ
ncbi:MAG: hypothetical protein KKC29_04965 [Alphaproteobacteria bacterium]|jgi:hypothetical protein|nr:hypothetical protein [Alphaproteobacteria bacterium]MBU2042245.1 hypothetical protein [Alphaproteobacteria bacterium]MBU2126044.1 hypothetical protein [Alphaproteobacteria bacterium]MBU2209270.1 hypothetical protein [Alphaproteobacteria bacterium]MBU2290430.1 hypothetical protein [Alphaproteobacteria bacterium]